MGRRRSRDCVGWALAHQWFDEEQIARSCLGVCMPIFTGNKTPPTASAAVAERMLESTVFKTIPGNGNGAAAPSAPTDRHAYLTQLRVKLHQKLVERLNVQNLRAMPANVVRQECRTLIRELYQTEKGLLTSAEQEKLMEDVMDETFGLGPLENLLKDPTVTDI